MFFDECILRKAKGGVGGSNWKENLGIWEREYYIEQIPELPVEEVGSRAHKEELVSIVWRKTSPSQPGEKKEKMEVDRDSMEEHWGVHFWRSQGQGFLLRRGCQDARRERSRSEASLRERSKSWPRAVGAWRLSRGWVDGAHFPGLGAKKTDCNLFPKLVLCWVGRQKNGTSVSLLFTPTLLGIQCLYLVEYHYKIKRDTNWVTWRFWGAV